MENTINGSHDGHLASDLPRVQPYFESSTDDFTKQTYQSYFDIRCQLFRTKFFQLKRKIEEDAYTGYSITGYFKEHGQLNMDWGRQTGSSYWHSYFLHECEKVGARTIS
ncbi:hypothetical protein KY334_06255, partial [Candidatus Woesearchaeota archaeon]|nr:hypothetical protein [Candidatus Woesearchaeota archaeon]